MSVAGFALPFREDDGVFGLELGVFCCSVDYEGFREGPVEVREILYFFFWLVTVIRVERRALCG